GPRVRHALRHRSVRRRRPHVPPARAGGGPIRRSLRIRNRPAAPRFEFRIAASQSGPRFAFLTLRSGDTYSRLADGGRRRIAALRLFPGCASAGDEPHGRSDRRECAKLPEVDVRLVDVVKKFGEMVAVDSINLEVRDGEFFSLLGPSGCGKTTTLRMIGGFQGATARPYWLPGHD